MAVTYTPIATATATGSQSEILFTNISQAYTDLVVVVQATESGSDGMDMRVGGSGGIDAGNNYSFTVLRGQSGSASSYRVSDYSSVELGQVNSTQNILIAHVMNYSNTTTYKTVIGRENNADVRVAARVSVWRNTSAITQLSFKNGSYVNHTAGSTFSLYGILKA